MCFNWNWLWFKVHASARILGSHMCTSVSNVQVLMYTCLTLVCNLQVLVITGNLYCSSVAKRTCSYMSTATQVLSRSLLSTCVKGGWARDYGRALTISSIHQTRFSEKNPFSKSDHTYRTLVKEGPWAVHLTLGQDDWGMGRYSRYQYRIYTRKSAQVNYPR